MVDRDLIAVVSELAAEEALEKVILRSLNEGVITVECTGRIHTVNPAALRILGLREDQIKGRNCREVFCLPENDEFNALLVQLVEKATETRHEETRYTRPDGQKVDISVATTFLAVDECSPGMESLVVVVRDITPFKSLERVRKLAVDHLAHELKTPLAIIGASVEILFKNNNLDEKAARDHERIRRNLDRLLNMQIVVEEILDPPQYRAETLSVATVVEGKLAELRSQCENRRVSLTSDSEDFQSEILDSNIVSMVLETLVKNAVENTPDGGEVTVSVKHVQEGVLLQVRDTGVGIPISDQEFIFDGFHHTKRTEDYSSKRPFEFNAGGKGLELLRLKALSELGYFDISFESSRCLHLPTRKDQCPGEVERCPHIHALEDCRKSGGTTFSVLFRGKELRKKYLQKRAVDRDRFS